LELSPKGKIMALQKTVTTIHDFSAINAYHRVESLSLIGKDQIKFHLRSYVEKNKPLSDEQVNKPFFAEQVMLAAYAIEGQNPIKQAYEYLKTLPEFAGAVDC
jgi:hypothetical protein